MIRPFVIFLLSLLITVTLGAQGVSSAIISATIVSEVGITESGENNVVNFCNCKDDVQVINASGITTQTNIKTVEILSFKVISNENNFSITIPQTGLFIKKDNDLNNMTADLFVTTTANRKNDQLLSITSVFKENDFQSPGKYYSSPLEITVNYN